MTVSDKLNKLLLICATNKIEFHFEKTGEINTIEYADNKINIKIADSEDKQLIQLLDSKIAELENLFK